MVRGWLQVEDDDRLGWVIAVDRGGSVCENAGVIWRPIVPREDVRSWIVGGESATMIGRALVLGTTWSFLLFDAGCVASRTRWLNDLPTPIDSREIAGDSRVRAAGESQTTPSSLLGADQRASVIGRDDALALTARRPDSGLSPPPPDELPPPPLPPGRLLAEGPLPIDLPASEEPVLPAPVAPTDSSSSSSGSDLAVTPTGLEAQPPRSDPMQPATPRLAAPSPRPSEMPPIPLKTPLQPAPPASPAPQPGQAVPSNTTQPGSLNNNATQATPEAIILRARQVLESIRNYQVTMVRQERVGGQLQEPERLVLSRRREDPVSVRLEWVEGPYKGREVIHSPVLWQGKLHVRMPNNKLMPRMAISPDNPMVTRASRHPIQEAGIEGVLDSMLATLEARRRGEAVGSLRLEGITELGGRRLINVRRDDPNGEVWVVGFDERTGLPLAIEGRDRDGNLLERYQFFDPRFDLAELSKPEAFDPDARWGVPPRGTLASLLSGLGGREPTEEDLKTIITSPSDPNAPPPDVPHPDDEPPPIPNPDDDPPGLS